MSHLQSDLLNAKLNLILASAGITPTTATMPQISKATENIKQAPDKPIASKSKTSRRDIFLGKLPATQQVEILKWAEQQNIRPDEALWMLVDLLGYTKFMSETLPSRMRAAGQQAVEAIALQRQAEADAFSGNTQKALGEMLKGITAQVANESKNITNSRLRQELWRYGLLVTGGILALSAMCFVFGYTFGKVNLPWLTESNPNQFINIVKVILGLPVGYLIAPIVMTAFMLFMIDEVTAWLCQR
jgi:hypothetical protein